MEKASESLLLVMEEKGPLYDETRVSYHSYILNFRFGHAFMMDSGSSTGEISGHSKTVNAVSIRQQRPYRAATSGDDSVIVFFTGEISSSNPDDALLRQITRCSL